MLQRGIVEVDVDTSDDEEVNEVLETSAAVDQLQAADMLFIHCIAML